MKITCNIIEDLLPLYIDDMVSEDSRQLVEEHLKECAACRKMLDEMKKENQLRTVSGNAKRKSDRCTEISPLKKNSQTYPSETYYFHYFSSGTCAACEWNRALLVLR